MAYGDTNTSSTGSPDGEETYTYAPKTAQQNAFVADYPNEDRLKRDDERRAKEANVTGVDKIDYAEALANYESRSDVELFANRRAREYATTFAAQDFTRTAAQEAAPFQSSTLGSTTVVKGDAYTDGPDAGTADDVVTAPSGGDEQAGPSAPTAVTATAVAGARATVTWTAPTNTGGQPLTGYTVLSAPGGISVSVPAGTTTASVTGLTVGTAYTFTVRAASAEGTSPASAPSNSVTAVA